MSGNRRRNELNYRGAVGQESPLANFRWTEFRGIDFDLEKLSNSSDRGGKIRGNEKYLACVEENRKFTLQSSPMQEAKYLPDAGLGGTWRTTYPHL